MEGGDRKVRFVFWKDHLGCCVQNILVEDHRDCPGVSEEAVTIIPV